MAKKQIRIFDLQFDDTFKKKFHAGVERIFTEGFFSNHTFVKEFETSFCEFNNSKYAVAVSSGTSALEISLRAIDIFDKYVLLPSNTFIATAVAVRNAGGIPVLVDIEQRYFSMCSDSLKNSLNDFDISKVGAVICVHIGGHISDEFNKVIKVCEEHDIDLIEDSAHAHGAKLDNIQSGNFGRFGCFSFFTTKIMTTGEGGIVTCKSEADYKKLLSLRQFGKTEQDSSVHELHGSNFKMNEFSALMGVLEVERINSRIKRRRDIARIYKENLDSSKYHVVSDSDHQFGTYYKQIVVSKSLHSSKIKEFCQEAGISITGGVYHTPVHQQPIYKKLDNKPLIRSEEFANMHFCPPCYPELKDEEISYICGVLNEL